MSDLMPPPSPLSPPTSSSWSLGATTAPLPPATPTATPTSHPFGVESVLSACTEVLGFDIAEMWLRTGPKTHQLTHSHLRPSSMERGHVLELNEIYYGTKSTERTHRLSPALCKRAKESGEVVWLTESTEGDVEALRSAISEVRTAVAVPVMTHGMNVTVIFFCVRRFEIARSAVDFVVHMSLSAAIASVNTFKPVGEEGPTMAGRLANPNPKPELANTVPIGLGSDKLMATAPEQDPMRDSVEGDLADAVDVLSVSNGGGVKSKNISRPDVIGEGDESNDDGPDTPAKVNPALDLKWSALQNVEYLTDGGNTWIHTAVIGGRPVVVKTLKPECQDVALAINEIEGELDIHSKLVHKHICGFVGAGCTSKGMRFLVLERLDGGTLTQVLGYDTRIRDRRRRFWKRRPMSYIEVLTHAGGLADALAYLNGSAISNSMVLHRDLKPDNIGFTLDQKLKLIDFGLAKIVENATPACEDVYRMSGETGSLRYMAPEVADNQPYNHKADVYSFGIILWEMTAYKKPYEGLSREQFYKKVVKGGERPPMSKKWPKELQKLIASCWGDIEARPQFSEVALKLSELLAVAKGGEKKKGIVGSLMDRHSTWF